MINEAELSDQLEMSRTPIREALILLKEEGLVDIVPQKGSNVSYISRSGVREGYFMRCVLESVMIQELASKLSNDQIYRLKSNLTLQEEVLRTSPETKSTDFFLLDDQLHRLIYEFSGRERMWESTHKVCTHYDRIRFLDTVANNVDELLILEQHKALYYYLMIGIPENVDINHFCKAHMGRWLEHAQYMLSTYPDYFID